MDFLKFLEKEINADKYDYKILIERIDNFISQTKAKVFIEGLVDYVAQNYGPSK